MSVIISSKTFNESVKRAKPFFGGDRHKAEECLATSLYGQDYNVVAAKLKAQAKTANGYLSTMPKSERKSLMANLSSLSAQIAQYDNQKTLASENAQAMLSEFSGVHGYKGSVPKVLELLLLIERTLNEVGNGIKTECLVLRDIHKATDCHGEYAYDALVNGELFMDGLTIRWRDLPTESDAEGRCFDEFKSKEAINLTIGGEHWVDWVRRAVAESKIPNEMIIAEINEAKSSLGELFNMIGRCTFDCYTPDIELPVETIKAIQELKLP